MRTPQIGDEIIVSRILNGKLEDFPARVLLAHPTGEVDADLILDGGFRIPSLGIQPTEWRFPDRPTIEA